MQDNNAAERMRPILEAMEKSVNAARRKRLGEPEPAAIPPAPHGQGSGMNNGTHSSNGYHAPRAHAPNGSGVGSQTQPSHRPNSHGTMIGGETSPPAPAETVDQDPNAKPARLKAKPKRPSGFSTNPAENTWRSQAG